jgi:hypothetical protein
MSSLREKLSRLEELVEESRFKVTDRVETNRWAAVHGRDLLPDEVKEALTVPGLNEIGGCPVTLCRPYMGTCEQKRLCSNDTLGTWNTRIKS